MLGGVRTMLQEEQFVWVDPAVVTFAVGGITLTIGSAPIFASGSFTKSISNEGSFTKSIVNTAG